MDIQVRELLAEAAYHGITRREIAERAQIASTSFSNWKVKSPRLSTLNKAKQALQEIIDQRGRERDEVESKKGVLP